LGTKQGGETICGQLRVCLFLCFALLFHFTLNSGKKSGKKNFVNPIATMKPKCYFFLEFA